MNSDMTEIIRLTEGQHRKVRSLIKSDCANFYAGNCLLLDWHTESCQCPQMLTRSLVCRWFKNAVLPIDRELNEEIRKTSSQHLCRDCGDWFYPEHCNTLFCPKCRLLRARESKRKWAAKNRARE